MPSGAHQAALPAHGHRRHACARGSKPKFEDSIEPWQLKNAISQYVLRKAGKRQLQDYIIRAKAYASDGDPPGRENPNRWATLASNRAHGAGKIRTDPAQSSGLRSKKSFTQRRSVFS